MPYKLSLFFVLNDKGGEIIKAKENGPHHLRFFKKSQLVFPKLMKTLLKAK
jgi:hypothetical protein